MAILSVNEITGAQSSINEKGQPEYGRVFQVVTNSALVGNLEVRTATGVPRTWDVYATATEVDSRAVCTKVSAQQDSENPRVWQVHVDYGAPTGGDQDQQNPNPLLRPAVMTWASLNVRRLSTRI